MMSRTSRAGPGGEGFIAPDLPGIGNSAIPADGLDMKTAAIRILGIENAKVVGHDIGLMVAWCAAASCHSSLCRSWRAIEGAGDASRRGDRSGAVS
jgi:pimeloyl-ACP methyl ester carboxylesterase